ncbi:dephospho-CoA kinase [Priestia megaterium]|uniref:dephospho-CoA kinase n=1 Tax=Priestia megaterium TaxID=1404 RepID=UPI003457EF29
MAETTKIVLCGKLRSGKSLAAAYLTLFYGAQPYAFADEMKDSFHRAFPNIMRNPKPRAFYVKFGEWACEVFGDNVWVDKVLRKIEAANHSVVLISDMRKAPEYAKMQAEGYTIIKITADDGIRIQRAIEAGDDFTEADLTNRTETFIDNIAPHYTVANNSDTDSFYDRLDVIMAELGVEKAVRGE